jgi:GNAT superfamily N-acetyltransferase
MSRHLVVTDAPGAAVADVILPGLVAFNEAGGGPSHYRPLAVLVTDEAGKTLGGLSGVTYWRWLYIQLFWLPEPLRDAGLGTEILASAEAEARARGCVDVWLDSFSFQAPGFYQRHGYRSFGTLDDYPPGQRRVFLTKRLG